MKHFTGKGNVLPCAFRILMYVSVFWSAVKIKLVTLIEMLLRVFSGLVCVSFLWVWKEHHDVDRSSGGKFITAY
jgi:hypothetical protein